MTTIVVKDGVIASDSATVINAHTRCELVVYRTKLRRSSCNRLAIGTTGAVLTDSGFESLTRFVLSGIEELDERGAAAITIDGVDDSTSALILTSNGHYLLDCQKLVKDVEGLGMSVGSGSEYATVAILMGRSAVECVELAIRLDDLSGGEVYSIAADTLAPIDLGGDK